ncbi:MAG: putative glycosyltransferase EpsE [Segetibacter sp.]|nr:putative glycosyltransferase EpsE [Segetibacter sp.]
MQDPIVSVLMLTYNHEKYIKEAVESVLTQDAIEDIELVISNDCSSDNTGVIVQDIIRKHPKGHKIKYFGHEINVGIGRNFSFTLQQCIGKYVALCDGDDFWIDPLKLRKQVDILESNEHYSMVCSNQMLHFPDGGLKKNEFETKQIIDIQDVINGFIPGAQTILFRNYASGVDFFTNHEHIYGHDRYVAYFCSLFGKIYRMDDFTAAYRMSGEGLWTQFSSIDKLKKYSSVLQDFHRSIGIPENNEILASVAFRISLLTFTYCLKRPRLLLKKENLQVIFSPWRKFNKMNRLKFVFGALKNRFFAR